jgi:hypothetical protein
MMTRTAADAAVDRYLDRLDLALDGVPAARRDELLREIIAHIVEARRELPDPGGEAGVRTILDRLGDPGEIAAAAREPGDPAPSAGPGRARDRGTAASEDLREKLALVLLLFGWILGGLGWPAGVALLWLSPRWSDREKVLGTLVLPGGLLAAFFLAFFSLTGAIGGTLCAADDGGSIGVVTAGDIYDSGALPDTCASGPLAHPLLFLALAIAVLAPLAAVAFLASRLKATR